MIYDIRYVRIESEHGGWTLQLQVKRHASADWENVRDEHDQRGGALPTNDAVRSLS